MVEMWLWAGRVAVLGALLAYLWTLGTRVASSLGQSLRAGSEDAPGSESCLELVQDNTVAGVTRCGGAPVPLRGRVPVGEEIVLGRHEENGLVLGDRFTSARHARVYRRGTQYYVEDLGSKNGTLLNGHRIGEAQPLESGDRITVGSCTFRFMG